MDIRTRYDCVALPLPPNKKCGSIFSLFKNTSKTVNKQQSESDLKPLHKTIYSLCPDPY